MRIGSLLLLGCTVLSAALTPAQINQKFKKMQDISNRCMNKANQLTASDGTHINSPSSRFHDIFKGMDEIDSIANEISRSVEGLPARYSSADSTVVMDGFEGFGSQQQDLYTALNGNRQPFAGMASVCNAVSKAISSDQDSLGRLGLALFDKVATSDQYVVTRIRAGLGKQSSNVHVLYCMGINNGS
ncbi:unnamed protein product [Clonostachys rosea]|uniref:Uncharacterized protein n=1 Tax=Bionectria ochroleuca TaxID=29856 RepID=A0ABY6U1B6_BIOOC|nr:unnamed protein product [Clonostachys rosea]